MNRSLPRFVYAIMGVLVLLFAGLVYAWTTFSKPLTNNPWSQDALTWTSTIVIIFFCLGGFFGGVLQKKGINVKLNLVASAVLMLAGFLISGLLGNLTGSIVIIYLGFGVLCGLAAGFSYNAVLSVVSRWFPDKQGLISGIMLMGYGISAFLMGLLYASNVDQMDGKGGIPWYFCFLGIGAGCFIVIMLGALILKNPGLDFVSPTAKKGKKKSSLVTYEEVTPTKMVKKLSFWLLFIWTILTSVAGLAVVFLGTPIATAAVPSLNDKASVLAIIVGLISIFNGIGRIIFGGLFDKIGYKATMLIDCGLFIIAIGFIILAMVTGSQLILIISFILTGLSYGGVPPIQSAFVNKFYGSINYGQNLPIMTMSLLVSSFGSKLVQAVQSGLMGSGMTNSEAYIVVLGGVVVICVIAVIITLLIRKPKSAGSAS